MTTEVKRNQIEHAVSALWSALVVEEDSQGREVTLLVKAGAERRERRVGRDEKRKGGSGDVE